VGVEEKAQKEGEPLGNRLWEKRRLLQNLEG
jgi:hypothetical protein